MFPASVPLFYLLGSAEKGFALLPPGGGLLEVQLMADFCLQTLLTAAMFVLDSSINMKSILTFLRGLYGCPVYNMLIIHCNRRHQLKAPLRERTVAVRSLPPASDLPFLLD